VFRRIEITNNNTGDSKARKRGSTEKTCFLSRAFFFFSFFLPSPPGIIFSSRESNEIIIDCCPSRVILIANLILGRIAARYFQRIARISELSNRSLDVSGGQSSSTGRARIECHIGIAIGTESESALKVVAAPLLSLFLSLSSGGRGSIARASSSLRAPPHVRKWRRAIAFLGGIPSQQPRHRWQRKFSSMAVCLLLVPHFTSTRLPPRTCRCILSSHRIAPAPRRRSFYKREAYPSPTPFSLLPPPASRILTRRAKRVNSPRIDIGA